MGAIRPRRTPPRTSRVDRYRTVHAPRRRLQPTGVALTKSPPTHLPPFTPAAFLPFRHAPKPLGRNFFSDRVALRGRNPPRTRAFLRTTVVAQPTCMVQQTAVPSIATTPSPRTTRVLSVVIGLSSRTAVTSTSPVMVSPGRVGAKKRQ